MKQMKMWKCVVAVVLGGAIMTACAGALTASAAEACVHVPCDEWEEEEEPTCTEPGTEVQCCSICGEILNQREVPAVGHTPGEWEEEEEPTCTEPGVEVQYCEECEEELDTREVPATGHSFGDWETLEEATVFAPKTEERECEDCGEVETREVGKALKPSITVNTEKIVLKTKQSTTALKVSGLANGDSVESYTSGDKKLVTVTSKGKITARSKTGSTKITIELESGLKKTIAVEVQSDKILTKSITGVPKKLTLKKGAKETLKPVLKPVTSSEKLTYKSSKSSVASVSTSGVITAKKPGKTVITVKSGKKTVKCTVTVKKK